MKFIETKLAGVVIIEPKVFADDRGWFMESFNEPLFHEQLAEFGHPIPRPFVQDNHSCSKKHVLRGLHFQRDPHAQGKLVRVTAGSAYDVAVDIRKGSETFGQWLGLNSPQKMAGCFGFQRGLHTAFWRWRTILSFSTRPQIPIPRLVSNRSTGMTPPLASNGQ